MDDSKSLKVTIKRPLTGEPSIIVEPPKKIIPMQQHEAIIPIEKPESESPQRKAKKNIMKLKIGERTYKNKDCVYIKDKNQIGRIENIKFEGEDEKNAKIEIKWFYKRADLEREGIVKKDEHKYICENEVFETNCKSIIPQSFIFEKCKIYNFDDYEKRPIVSFDDFYTRANYDLILVF